MVGLSRWLIGLLERLMKQCVYVGDQDIVEPSVKPLAEMDPWLSPSSEHIIS